MTDITATLLGLPSSYTLLNNQKFQVRRDTTDTNKLYVFGGVGNEAQIGFLGEFGSGIIGFTNPYNALQLKLLGQNNYFNNQPTIAFVDSTFVNNTDNTGIIYNVYEPANYQDISNIFISIPPQTPSGALTTKYFLRAQILPFGEEGTVSADWVLDIEGQPPTPCIHPDMIIDELRLPIKNISQCHNMQGYQDNLKLGYTNKFINIKKGSLGQNLPTADLLLTPQHPITYCGTEIKAGDLVGNIANVERVELETPVMVYTLAFNTRKTIKMHGVDVWQWDITDFKNFCNRLGYTYDGQLMYGMKH